MRNAAIVAVVVAAAVGSAPWQASPDRRTVDDAGFVTDWSAQRAKASRAAAEPRIACTRAGCGPVPSGCAVRPGRDLHGNFASGGQFDEVVCP
jgi:hypothetical protein